MSGIPILLIYPTALYPRYDVQSLDFYFDRGTAEAQTGTIEMDNLKLAWYLIHATNLHADITNGTTIRLIWDTTDPDAVGSYKIYRSGEPRFAADES